MDALTKASLAEMRENPPPNLKALVMDDLKKGVSVTCWHTLGNTADKCSPQSLKAVGDVMAKVVYDEKWAGVWYCGNI